MYNVGLGSINAFRPVRFGTQSTTSEALYNALPEEIRYFVPGLQAVGALPDTFNKGVMGHIWCTSSPAETDQIFEKLLAGNIIQEAGMDPHQLSQRYSITPVMFKFIEGLPEPFPNYDART